MSKGIAWSTLGYLERKRKVVVREVTWAGRNIQRDVVLRMRAPGKSGKVYLSRGAGKGRAGGDAVLRKGPDGRRHWYAKGKRYTASAPGQAPAVDIGELATHVGYAVRESGWMLRAVIGAIAGRASSERLLIVMKSLEGGAKFRTRRGGIDPRPAFVPALRTEGPLFQKRLAAAWRAAVR